MIFNIAQVVLLLFGSLLSSKFGVRSLKVMWCENGDRRRKNEKERKREREKRDSKNFSGGLTKVKKFHFCRKTMF